MNSPDEMFSSEKIKVTLMLADYAAVAQDKLTVVGAGWTFTNAETAPFAIAAIIEVPWNETNQNHKFRLSLGDIDGNPVEVETPEGMQPIFFEGEFQVGRPPGVRWGRPSRSRSRSTTGRWSCRRGVTTCGSSPLTELSTRTGASRSLPGRRRKPKLPRSI